MIAPPIPPPIPPPRVAASLEPPSDDDAASVADGVGDAAASDVAGLPAPVFVGPRVGVGLRDAGDEEEDGGTTSGSVRLI